LIGEVASYPDRSTTTFCPHALALPIISATIKIFLIMTSPYHLLPPLARTVTILKSF
jgi:hypothetical protein